MIKVKVKILPHGKGLPLPKYMSHSASGMDLIAAVEEPVTIGSGSHKLIPTGISIAIPRGHEGEVRPRSGLALKYGVTVLNTPGTIDADYRGEVQVILINHGKEDFVVKRGDRIAQLIINKVVEANLEEVPELPNTGRNEGGFGHTGI